MRRLISFATHKTGAFETIGLILTYLNRVPLSIIRDLLEKFTLEEGFAAINKKLVEFLREPEQVLPQILTTNDLPENLQQSSEVNVASYL